MERLSPHCGSAINIEGRRPVSLRGGGRSSKRSFKTCALLVVPFEHLQNTGKGQIAFLYSERARFCEISVFSLDLRDWESSALFVAITELRAFAWIGGHRRNALNFKVLLSARDVILNTTSTTVAMALS